MMWNKQCARFGNQIPASAQDDINTTIFKTYNKIHLQALKRMNLKKR